MDLVRRSDPGRQPVTSTAQPSPSAPAARSPHVAISRFEVLDGWQGPVAEAFRNRPRLVDDAPGFQRLEVLRPADRPREFWLLTWWDDEASFRTWHREHRAAAHQYLPPGLRLVPGSARIESFEHVAS